MKMPLGYDRLLNPLPDPRRGTFVAGAPFIGWAADAIPKPFDAIPLPWWLMLAACGWCRCPVLSHFARLRCA